MVDIIVVSYNHSQFVVDCLNSIKKQTFTNFHLTIVDDFSSDDSAKIIEKWVEENSHIPITLYLNKKNVGLCQNLNTVLRNTQNPYIKIIAADDYLASTYLEKAVKTLQNLPEEYAVLHTKARYIDENKQPILSKVFFEKSHKTGDVEQEVFRQNYICAPSVLLRRKIYDAVGLYSPDIILEDYELWLKAVNKGFKFVFLDEILTFYRYHSENMTKKKSRKIHMESVYLRIKYDDKGKNSRAINTSLLELYKIYGKNIESSILSLYEDYKGKSSLLLGMIKQNVPYIIIRIIRKILMK